MTKKLKLVPAVFINPKDGTWEVFVNGELTACFTSLVEARSYKTWAENR